jgi:hypothetical protein
MDTHGGAPAMHTSRHKPSAQRFFLEECGACFHTQDRDVWQAVAVSLRIGLIHQATELESRLLEVSMPFARTPATRAAETAELTQQLPAYARAVNGRLPQVCGIPCEHAWVPCILAQPLVLIWVASAWSWPPGRLERFWATQRIAGASQLPGLPLQPHHPRSPTSMPWRAGCCCSAWALLG